MKFGVILKKQNLNLIFGFLLGMAFAGLLLIIALLSNHLDHDVSGQIKYGDIMILPREVDKKTLPGNPYSLLFQKSQKVFLTLYFDGDKNLTNISFIKDEAPIFSATYENDSENWVHSSYGYYELGTSYFDWNCDGILDFQSSVKGDFIFVNDAWIKIDDRTGNTVEVKSGDVKLKYVFTGERGWALVADND